jgi:hypothetical protein
MCAQVSFLIARAMPRGLIAAFSCGLSNLQGDTAYKSCEPCPVARPSDKGQCACHGLCVMPADGKVSGQNHIEFGKQRIV